MSIPIRAGCHVFARALKILPLALSSVQAVVHTFLDNLARAVMEAACSKANVDLGRENKAVTIRGKAEASLREL